jgi:hypothetical protein
MTAISPEARALIDRLHAVDIARPRQDSEAVENAFNRHLAALGLPARPIRGMPDASSAYQRMIDLADSASRLDATRAAREAARSTWFKRELAARNAAHGLALDISRGVCTDDAYFEAQSAANGAAADASGDASERQNAARTACREVALEASWVLALLRAKWTASETIWEAAGSRTDDGIWSAAYHAAVDDLGALTPAVRACEERNALAAFAHPAQQQLVDIWLPMLEAFEAGLLCYWVTPEEVVWVSRPSVSIVDGRLHREDSPAVEWVTGERYWFWRGTRVPQWVIEDPSRITPAVIRSEVKEDVRRCMIERLGNERTSP